MAHKIRNLPQHQQKTKLFVSASESKSFELMQHLSAPTRNAPARYLLSTIILKLYEINKIP